MSAPNISDPKVHNHYSMLGVAPDATTHEIKKARDRLARIHHTDKGGDKSFMQKINEAFRVLSDPKLRADYNSNNAEDIEEAFPFKAEAFITGGRRWSDDYIDKINFWKMRGAIPSDSSIRKKRPDDKNRTYHSEDSSFICHNFLSSTVAPTDEILKSLVPAEVLKFNSTPIWKCPPYLVQILNSDIWEKKCLINPKIQPFGKNLSHLHLLDEMEKIKKASKDAQANKFEFPKSDPFIKAELEAFFEVKTFRNPFAEAPSHHRCGTKVPLAPESLREKLGFIPEHCVPARLIALPSEAISCACCRDAFGLFTSRYNCTLCGKAACGSCTEFRNVPLYTGPTRVCKPCGPEIGKKFASAWVEALQDKSNRSLVKPAYLLLIDELGYATKAQFLRLADLFWEDGNRYLAMQCIISGGGDWWKFALKAVEGGNYVLAMHCLYQIKQNSSAWFKEGDKFVESNPKMALLCYHRAHYDSKGYFEKALDSSNFMQCTLLLLNSLNFKHREHFASGLEILAGEIIDKGNYILAMACYALFNSSQDSWINIVNRIPLKAAAYAAQYMNDTFKCEWHTIRFQPEKNYLSWRFYLSEASFSRLLDYLIYMLRTSSDLNCIPYLKSCLIEKGVNFLAERDAFFEKGEYLKAFFSHVLSPQPIPWTELALKLRRKNESASLVISRNFDQKNWEGIEEQFFNQKQYSLALRVYLENGSKEKILEKAKSNPETALLYHFALYKSDPKNAKFIATLCQTLLANKCDRKLVKDFIISTVVRVPKNQKLQLYKLLAQMEPSLVDLQGLLHVTEFLCETLEDAAWHAKLKAKFLEQFEDFLGNALYHCSYANLLTLFEQITVLTVPSVNKILEERFTIDSMEASPLKAAGLAVRGMARRIDPQWGIIPAMNDLSEAMLLDPSEDFLTFLAQVVEKISIRFAKESSIPIKSLSDLTPARPSEFIERLKTTPELKMLIISEKKIRAFKPFDAAMATIDLCMSAPGAAALVGGMLMAAHELLKAQPLASDEEKYAYRRASVDLVQTAYSLGIRHLSPSTLLYTLRVSISILTSVTEPLERVSELESLLLEVMHEKVNELSSLFPLMQSRMLQLYDLVYLDLINRSFLITYLPMRRAAKDQVGNPTYQYWIFEGTWQGWLPDDKFTFEVERIKTMDALLAAKENTWKQVETLMQWPALTRDADGWLSSKAEPLNLGPVSFSQVQGIRFDLNTGEITFILETSDNPMHNLIDMSDLIDIMNSGVTSAYVTLEQPDPKMAHHPFQNMEYGPKCLSGTNYLATMLHADILLKMLSTGTEVSGVSPFALRDVEEGLLKRLPDDLKGKFRELRRDLPQTAGRVHRFWIEAGDLLFFQEQEKNVVTYIVGSPQMSVKKHLMQYDRDGKLIDTENDEETDSPEAKFAKLMTDEYDNLGKYFPELARLTELTKLQALSIFAQGIYQSMQGASERYEADEEEILSFLRKIKSNSKYPRATSNNIEECLNANLREQGLTKDQVSYSELERVRRDIKIQLEKQDREEINFLAQSFRANYHLSINPEKYINNWLSSGDRHLASLVQIIKQGKEAFQKDEILRICHTFHKSGIATELDKRSDPDMCTWVPAAFKYDGHSKVYGGVHMSPHIVDVAKMTHHTFHGLHQAIGRDGGRGVSISAMADALNHPKRVVEQADGSTKYVGKNAAVVLQPDAKIRTTYGSARGPQQWDWGKK